MSEKHQNPLDPNDAFFEMYGLRIMRAIRRIIRAVDIHSRRLYATSNITTPQMICLYSVVRTQPMTLTELAKQVNLGTSTVNGIVDRLEQRGLVCRKRDSVDRRKVFLEATESGRELSMKTPSLLQDRLASKLCRLPEIEQAAIAVSLERVVELMEADHIDASPNLISGTPV